MIFIGSCGIAVRAVAPHLAGKLADPAVLAVDELGTYCVSLLSGHVGGANRLCRQVAGLLSAIPVITTATDCSGVFAVDDWAAREGMTIANPERIKWVSARLLSGDRVGFHSAFAVEGVLPKGLYQAENGYDILVTWRTRGRQEALRLIPRVVTLGIGCRKEIPQEALETACQLILKKAGCHPAAIGRVCSIDLKRNEPGLLHFCKAHGLPFFTYSAEQLNALAGDFSPSAFVRQVTGVDNVCQRSALMGSGSNGRLLTGKEAGNGVAMALAVSDYTVQFTEGETTWGN